MATGVSSSVAAISSLNELSAGGSLMSLTVTSAAIGIADNAPSSSRASTEKASCVLSVGVFISASGVQYALFDASIVSLPVTEKGVAVADVAPIVSVPELTAVTTKALTTPSMSVSLPLVSRSLSVIATSVSSSVVATADVNKLRAGSSLMSFTCRIAVIALSDTAPSSSRATAVNACCGPSSVVF